jgi:hypothetical protein
MPMRAVRDRMKVQPDLWLSATLRSAGDCGEELILNIKIGGRTTFV